MIVVTGINFLGVITIVKYANHTCCVITSNPLPPPFLATTTKEESSPTPVEVTSDPPPFLALTTREESSPVPVETTSDPSSGFCWHSDSGINITWRHYCHNSCIMRKEI